MHDSVCGVCTGIAKRREDSGTERTLSEVADESLVCPTRFFLPNAIFSAQPNSAADSNQERESLIDRPPNVIGSQDLPCDRSRECTTAHIDICMSVQRSHQIKDTAASHLPEPDLMRQISDKDGSGVISYEELHQGLSVGKASRVYLKELLEGEPPPPPMPPRRTRVDERYKAEVLELGRHYHQAQQQLRRSRAAAGQQHSTRRELCQPSPPVRADHLTRANHGGTEMIQPAVRPFHSGDLSLVISVLVVCKCKPLSEVPSCESALYSTGRSLSLGCCSHE